MTLSVVLPCFNEEANIVASVEDVLHWFAAKKIAGSVIVVDDGSTDRSARVLGALKKKTKKLRVIHLARNQGYGVAVRTGCDAATTDLIAFMDSDRQFHARDLSVLLARIGDYSFVTGRRRKRADPLLRRIFGKMLAIMNVLMLGLWVRDINCGMKMFRRSIWRSIRPVYGVEKLFNTEMFLRLKRKGIPWLQVFVPHYPRRAGQQTGGSVRVILRMFSELWGLKRNVK